MMDCLIHFANILFLPKKSTLFLPGRPGSNAWKIQFSFCFSIKIIFSHFVSETPFFHFIYFDCPRFFLDSAPQAALRGIPAAGRGRRCCCSHGSAPTKKSACRGGQAAKVSFGNNRFFWYLQGKKKRNGPNAAYCVEAGCWCRWRDLNPYGIATGGF